ncbi:MAG: shikimate kinase [Candidatus Heteroscillospira sp.]|jgi:shikimate dehydrogenase
MDYGLLGEKLAHSFSPQIHTLLGCPGYGLMEVPKNELEAFMLRRDFKAINVTIPYKRDVMAYCAHIDGSAREIGCVNTIVNRGGELWGWNTDFAGFLYMADRAGVDFAGAKVLILGSGGTSLTASAAVKSRGARDLVRVSRSGKVNYDNVALLHPDADIIVNTTPVGMYPNNGKAALELSIFKQLRGVLDVVYNPLKTALILQAEALGIPASGGLPMLVTQAVFAEEHFFGEKIPNEKYEEVLREIDAEKRSIILMGMPGCGKSSLGAELHRITGRDFIDLDQEIVREAGCSIPEIFAGQGEKAFRDMESTVLERASKQGGCIISLGGGSVLREENRAAIAQNGFVVYIRRDLNELPTDGRPLSKDSAALTELLRQRHPVYSACADCVCENSSTIPALAHDVLKKFAERKI